MTNVTPKLLAKLKAKAEKATKGAWAIAEKKYPHKYNGHHVERMIVTAYDDAQLKSPYPIVCVATGVGEGEKPVNFCHIAEVNANYIATANPATILALLAHIDSLAEQLAAEKAGHLKERARLDWALIHEAIWYKALNRFSYRPIGRMAIQKNTDSPRATIDAVMKGE